MHGHLNVKIIFLFISSVQTLCRFLSMLIFVIEFFIISMLNSFNNLLKSSAYLIYSHACHSKILNYDHVPCSSDFYGSQINQRLCPVLHRPIRVYNRGGFSLPRFGMWSFKYNLGQCSPND